MNHDEPTELVGCLYFFFFQKIKRKLWNPIFNWKFEAHDSFSISCLYSKLPTSPNLHLATLSLSHCLHRHHTIIDKLSLSLLSCIIALSTRASRLSSFNFNNTFSSLSSVLTHTSNSPLDLASSLLCGLKIPS